MAVFIAFFHASPALADDGPSSLSADEAVALALASHPDLRLAEATLRNADAARSRAALFLNNPQASAWTTLDGERSSLNASQPLSLTGTGWYAKSAARQASQGAQANLDRQRRVLAANTRRSYLNAAVATGRVSVAEEGADVAERLHYAINKKHEAGEASLLDLRLTRLTQVQAAVRLMKAQKAQAEALRSLSGWTLQPIDASLIVTDPGSVVPEGTEHQDQERADIIAARHRLRAAEKNLSRQRAATFPPVRIGIGIDQEAGEIYAGPTVGLTVPLFNRNQQGRAVARGQADVAEGRLSTLIATVDTEQRTARDRVAEAERLSSVLGDELAADAHAALASIEAGVLAGEIDLSTATLLQTQVLNGETAIVNLRGLVASARLDLLLATDDDALLGGAQ